MGSAGQSCNINFHSFSFSRLKSHLHAGRPGRKYLRFHDHRSADRLGVGRFQRNVQHRLASGQQSNPRCIESDLRPLGPMTEALGIHVQQIDDFRPQLNGDKTIFGENRHFIPHPVKGPGCFFPYRQSERTVFLAIIPQGQNNLLSILIRVSPGGSGQIQSFRAPKPLQKVGHGGIGGYLRPRRNHRPFFRFSTVKKAVITAVAGRETRIKCHIEFHPLPQQNKVATNQKSRIAQFTFTGRAGITVLRTDDGNLTPGFSPEQFFQLTDGFRHAIFLRRTIAFGVGMN